LKAVPFCSELSGPDGKIAIEVVSIVDAMNEQFLFRENVSSDRRTIERAAEEVDAAKVCLRSVRDVVVAPHRV